MIEQSKEQAGSGARWAPTGKPGGFCQISFPQTPVSPEAGIRAAIRDKYTKVAASASGKFQYPTGREGAAGLGYDPALIARAPSAMLESFCGVGNPFSLGPVRQGEALLDFGCGAGFDLFVAAHLVGKAGSVCGIDLTPDMADCARRNLVQAGIERFEIKTIASEHIAYADKTFDVVISNGVINLCIEKKTCFTEIYRVLKPGGRLQFADVVLEKEIPKNLSDSAEAWSQWIGGAVPVGDQARLLQEAGFLDIEYRGMTGYRTSDYTSGALFSARKI